MKVTPSTTGVNNKQIVNIFTYDAEHFGEQSIHIKRLYHKYKCRIAVVDGNGIGSGLVDWLVMVLVLPLIIFVLILLRNLVISLAWLLGCQNHLISKV